MARSPNYPAFGLQKALDLARKVYAANHLHKAAPAVVAKALGYTTVNGGSLTAISALRKYGLLEGEDKELGITKDALTVLVEPASSPERARLLVAMATKPGLFAELQAAYPGPAPNDDIMRSWLLRKGFLQSTVDNPIRAYRETMELAEAQKTIYNGGTHEVTEVAAQVVAASAQMNAAIERSTALTMATPQAVSMPTVSLTQGEREWLRGPLSRDAGYRLLVTGDMGPKEIGKLIKLLEAQKLVLDDDDDL